MVLEQDTLASRVLGLLNRVTHRGVVDHIAVEVATVAVQDRGTITADSLEFIAELVFKKALAEPRHCEALAYFAQSLRSMLPDVEDTDTHRNFHGFLLNICQVEFEEKLFFGPPLAMLALTITSCIESNDLCVCCCDLGGTARFVAQFNSEARLSALVAIVKKHCVGYCVYDVECFDEDGISEVPHSQMLKDCNKLVLKCSVERMECISVDDMEKTKQERRISRLNFMKFVGQLFIARCVCTRIVAAIMNGVMQSVDVGTLPGEDAIESLCKLIVAVGPKLDQGPQAYVVEETCKKMSGMRCQSTRVRYLLENMLEKRKLWMQPEE